VAAAKCWWFSNVAHELCCWRCFTANNVFLQVADRLRVCSTGGIMAAAERVEALALPLSCVDAFMADDSLAKTSGCCYGLMWGRHWLQAQQQQQQQQQGPAVPL
jgi:hypothetical protein